MVKNDQHLPSNPAPTCAYHHLHFPTIPHVRLAAHVCRACLPFSATLPLPAHTSPHYRLPRPHTLQHHPQFRLDAPCLLVFGWTRAPLHYLPLSVVQNWRYGAGVGKTWVTRPRLQNLWDAVLRRGRDELNTINMVHAPGRRATCRRHHHAGPHCELPHLDNYRHTADLFSGSAAIFFRYLFSTVIDGYWTTIMLHRWARAGTSSY